MTAPTSYKAPCDDTLPHDPHSYDAGGLWFVACPGVRDVLVDLVEQLGVAMMPWQARLLSRVMSEPGRLMIWTGRKR